MNKGAGFNLIDEAWIVVLRRDGHQQQVSILELFDGAKHFTAIGGEVPTQGFAITRLLLAFLHRAVDGPTSRDHWAELWEAPTLPMDVIASYAQKVRNRFDLFDPHAPFFQVASLRTAKGEISGLERLVADVPNGEPLFTTRSAGNLAQISAAEAARWLIHVHAFDTSGIKSGAVGDPTVKDGKGYGIGPGWCGHIGGVLLHGTNLRETLLLNLIGRDATAYVSIGATNDVPPWERDPDGPAWKERPPHGAIDLHTWQTRRVRLAGDRDGVTGVVLANGDRIQAQNKHGLDPLSAWQLSDTQTRKLKQTVYMPRKHIEDRSVWRGIAALLPSTAGRHSGGSDGQRYLAPGVLQWASDLAAQGFLPDSYTPGMRAYGAVYGSNQSTFAEIIDDEISLPIMLLRQDHPAAGATAVEAVSDAEKVAFEVWKLAENITQAAGAEAKTGFGDAAREDFYALLDAPYRSWLTGLTAQTNLNATRGQWNQTVRRNARTVADQLITAAPPAAWVGRHVGSRLVNVALTEAWFNAGLNRIIPPPPSSPTETTEDATE